MYKKISVMLVMASLLTGCVSLGGYEKTTQEVVAISQEEAEKIAFIHAGIAKDKVESLSTSFVDKGEPYYEVQFKEEGRYYSYKIAAGGGKILVSSKSDNPIETSIANLSVDETNAKRIAFEDAGVLEKDAVIKSIQRDYEDGLEVFEIDFYVDKMFYEYEISVNTGEIVKSSMSGYTTGLKVEGDIGEAKAKEIALAKVPGASDKHIYIKADMDDGVLIYEGEIIFEGMEYEFEIEAATGTILEWDVDSVH